MTRLLVAALMLCVSVPGVAEDHWYIGGGVGYFDADYKDGRMPHLNSTTLTVFAGWHFNDYLGVELGFERIGQDAEIGVDDGFETTFEAKAISPSLIVRYPLDRENLFEVFLRAGGSYMDYDVATPALGQTVQDTSFQPALGGGLRTKHFFVECVYYGRLEGLYFEEVRAGVMFRF